MRKNAQSFAWYYLTELNRIQRIELTADEVRPDHDFVDRITGEQRMEGLIRRAGMFKRTWMQVFETHEQARLVLLDSLMKIVAKDEKSVRTAQDNLERSKTRLETFQSHPEAFDAFGWNAVEDDE
jgi:hypothetical protein